MTVLVRRHRRTRHQRPGTGRRLAARHRHRRRAASSTAAASPGSGRAREAPAADDRIDCGGASVIPGFVDSHAHLVFAGDRAAEFAARMAGEPYDGGGIATTVAATRAADDADAARQRRPGSPTSCAAAAPPPSRPRAGTG